MPSAFEYVLMMSSEGPMTASSFRSNCNTMSIFRSRTKASLHSKHRYRRIGILQEIGTHASSRDMTRSSLTVICICSTDVTIILTSNVHSHP